MKKFIPYLFTLSLMTACKERYMLPGAGQETGYLVIDGVVNSGQGSTTLRITRTLKLVDDVGFKNEVGASVRLEGDDNSVHSLSEISDGFYYSPQLTLLDNVKYKLHINTADGREYISEDRTTLRTPPIDTLNWDRSEAGVEIFVNTHDPQNKTLYYRWEYDENWEFNSAFYSHLQFRLGASGLPITVDPRDPVESAQMFTCYTGDVSTNLFLGSSAKLSRDTIHLPLLFIPQNDWKLSVLYTILVKQYAVSRQGYEFLQRMKKNTEQVGTLFDAQPSELVGNVRCVTNPGEPVIGYIELSDLQTKRLWIRRNEVSPWFYRQACSEERVVNVPDSLAVWSSGIPTSVLLYSQRGDTLEILATYAECADCRLRGSPIKPSFWP